MFTLISENLIFKRLHKNITLATRLFLQRSFFRQYPRKKIPGGRHGQLAALNQFHQTTYQPPLRFHLVPNEEG